jgi:hypothetical protein
LRNVTMLNVSERLLRSAKAVQQSAAPELVAAITSRVSALKRSPSARSRPATTIETVQFHPSNPQQQAFMLVGQLP